MKYTTDEYHQYGLVRISATRYAKCPNRKCKKCNGRPGPAFAEREDWE